MDDRATIDGAPLWQIMGRSTAALLSGAPGLVTRVTPGAWRVTSDVDIWSANWLVCHGTDAPSLAMFQEVLAESAASGRILSVPVSHAIREQIEPLLAGLPVVSEGVDPMMWRDARPLPNNPRPYGGHVTPVGTGKDLTAVLDLIARAFNVDQAQNRLAMAGALDDPTMNMFTAISEALDSICMTWTEGHVTYISLMATDPERQRRGAGWAVMARAMETAIQNGTTRFFLEASSAGEGLYRQIGYETYERLEFWVVNPEG